MTFLSLARAATPAAILAASILAPADAAAMPSACSLVTLANVRTIVGAPVTVFHDQAPVMAKDGLEATNCLYMVSLQGELSASVWLGRGPMPHMVAMQQQFGTAVGHDHGVHGMRGNTIVVVNVASRSGHGVTYHDDLSSKLLAAVLAKL